MKIKIFKKLATHASKEFQGYYTAYVFCVLHKKKYAVAVGVFDKYVRPFFIRWENNDIEFDIQVNYFWFNARFYYAKLRGEWC